MSFRKAIWNQKRILRREAFEKIFINPQNGRSGSLLRHHVISFFAARSEKLSRGSQVAATWVSDAGSIRPCCPVFILLWENWKRARESNPLRTSSHITGCKSVSRPDSYFRSSGRQLWWWWWCSHCHAKHFVHPRRICIPGSLLYRRMY